MCSFLFHGHLAMHACRSRIDDCSIGSVNFTWMHACMRAYFHFAFYDLRRARTNKNTKNLKKKQCE